MAWFSWQQAKQLDPSLNALDGFFSEPPVKVQTVTGGLTNRCWRLESSQGLAYVWRPTSNVCKAFSISRHNEYQVLHAIEPLNLGPKPIFVHEQGLLVEWIDGITLTKDGIELEELLPIAATIHQYHSSSIPVVPFSYISRIDHYWLELEGKYVGSEFETLYKQWRSEPSVEQIPLALCHFDLGCYNLVRGDQGVKVIDWEYASLADPRLDLTLILQITGSPIEESVERYCQIRNIENTSVWLEGVKAWQPRTLVMAMLWYLLAYKLWGDEQYLNSAQEFKDLLCLEDHCFENS
ncbi:thiamine kinase [Vibrio parahaemolyticus]|uniref:thiamine kinase n=1 Tax=Vibrio parahaemolyticus TaxID=670 RepID=UPI00084B3EA0|nr:thiamine kinase [Vibrio parahaemolyticus]EID0695309.1 thiamine kinase [Vibrio parahaemolyticus]EIU6781673.1 thiamine kinase [Vibrio parahaemolyticus]EIU7002418.1 thiamine kinase [Vibrio parahaemolyticus]ELA8125671.1 thiamine kinase [Vibrio parahaemolyticus]ELA8144903.1 thiamine kinase [Vibrio parahaemolyticus]